MSVSTYQTFKSIVAKRVVDSLEDGFSLIEVADMYGVGKYPYHSVFPLVVTNRGDDVRLSFSWTPGSRLWASSTLKHLYEGDIEMDEIIWPHSVPDVGEEDELADIIGILAYNLLND